MYLRESIHKHTATVAIFFGVVILISLVVIICRSLDPGRETRTQAYFSSDDGKTWFADDINKLYPFEHDGKPAYRSYVYQCDGGTPFVGYLERLTDAARAKILELRKRPPTEIGNQIADIYSVGAEVKKPGSAAWVPSVSLAAGEIVRPRCPKGSDNLKGVYP